MCALSFSLSLSFLFSSGVFKRKLFQNRCEKTTQNVSFQFLLYELGKHVRLNWFYARHSCIVFLSIWSFLLHAQCDVGMCERVNQKFCAFFVLESFAYSDSICGIYTMFIDQSFLKLFEFVIGVVEIFSLSIANRLLKEKRKMKIFWSNMKHRIKMGIE